MLTTTELFDDGALTELISTAVLLGTDLKVGLFTNPITPSKRSVLADLTEPVYTGYARKSVVMGPPFRDPINGISSLSGTALWQQTSAPVSVILYGVFYTYAATPVLLGIDPFATPIALNDLLDAFSTVLQYIQSSSNQGFTTLLR